MTIFYKFVDSNFCRNGYEFHFGLNTDTKPFSPDPFCGGGFFFCELQDAGEWYMFGPYVLTLEVPESVPIVRVGDKMKAHQIIIRTMELWYENIELSRIILTRNEYAWLRIPEEQRTQEMRNFAVECNKNVAFLFSQEKNIQKSAKKK